MIKSLSTVVKHLQVQVKQQVKKLTIIITLRTKQWKNL